MKFGGNQDESALFSADFPERGNLLNSTKDCDSQVPGLQGMGESSLKTRIIREQGILRAGELWPGRRVGGGQVASMSPGMEGSPAAVSRMSLLKESHRSKKSSAAHSTP